MIRPMRGPFAAIPVGATIVLALMVLRGGIVPGATATARAPSVLVKEAKDPSTVINLNNTPILSPSGGVIGTLNNTTARPWGETYDPKNSCLYVTEDPQAAPGAAGKGPPKPTPALQGYLTYVGPGVGPASVPIPGGLGPQGVAWALHFYGETAAWKTAFPGGILAVADTGSNAVSIFGIPPLPTGAIGCAPVPLGTVGSIPEWTLATTFLTQPWDIVFDLHTLLFYATWGTGIVSAFAGLSPGCQFSAALSSPSGLSVDAKGQLEVANNLTNGWVTELNTTPVLDAAPGVCTGNVPAAVSAATLDGAVWTVPAPLVQAVASPTPVVRLVIGVSDSEQGTAGNLLGTGCTTGTPALGVVGELDNPTLACRSSVLIAGGPPPPGSPQTYGMAYNAKTHHILAVDNWMGQVEGFAFNSVVGVALAAPPMPFESVDVVWFLPSAASLAFWQGTPAAGSMVVTNWGAGTLFVATGM